MTELHRLLEELPADSPDRELLSSGVAARPPAGSKERTWNALVVALGAGSAAVAGSTQASAATAVTAKAAVAAPGVLSAVATKSVALGFAIGVGVIGAGQVASRLTQHEQAPVTVVSASANSEAYARAPKSTNAAAVQPSSVEREPSLAAPPAEAPLEPPASAPTTTLGRATPIAAQRALAASERPPPGASTETPTLSASEPKPSSLAEQARGLARIQRLLDAGSTAEAIRQLEVSLSSSDYSTLLEERDALYVQALFRAQRTAQGNLWAKRFVQRYPNSPHVEKMRRLLGEK